MLEHSLWHFMLSNSGSTLFIRKLLKAGFSARCLRDDQAFFYVESKLGKTGDRDKFKELLKDARKKNFHEEYKKLLKSGVFMITYREGFYPESLRNMDTAPAFFYARGRKELLLKRKIAIVGARDASDYGRKVSFDLGKEASGRDMVVVSGLAKGIDTYAHLGALEEMGGTIAVLGSGLMNIYPKENAVLAERIEKYGLLISEYPPEMEPRKYFFPERNRLISGLAEKVVIVEAKEKSGSLITAEFALDQGKDVLSVPGSIYWENSKGTNKLIQEGAEILLDIKTVFGTDR